MIVTKRPIPTGYLFTSEGTRGQLETLSIGDYGKRHNVKADFLGYTDEINGVENRPTMPLSEKWVITVSTQYGCTQKCNFCDVPNIPFRGNVSFEDLFTQYSDAISLFPNVRYTERLNLHFARMGEPILNTAVFEFARFLVTSKPYLQDLFNLRIEVIHPVLTTSMPKKFGVARCRAKLFEWCEIKNELYNGQAGLQISINSTDDIQREEMFGGSSLSLEEISEICQNLPVPVGRKYCLNFAYSTDYKIDANRLRSMFDPEKFMCKITPIHNNDACRNNGIKTVGGYETFAPYRPIEEALKGVGFDVLVFVPSMDEEDGLVTCGNLVLGGGIVTAEPKIMIEGESA